MWWSLSLKRYVGQDYKVHAMSAGQNSTETSAQFPRNSRAQSILQTETSMLWEVVFTEVLLNTTGTKCWPQRFTIVSVMLCDSWFLFLILQPDMRKHKKMLPHIEKQKCKVDNLIAEHLKPIILVNIVVHQNYISWLEWSFKVNTKSSTNLIKMKRFEFNAKIKKDIWKLMWFNFFHHLKHLP